MTTDAYPDTPWDVFVAFLGAMHDWEVQTYRRSNSLRDRRAEIEADLRTIFARYCVSYDEERGISCKTPPEHDPRKATLVHEEEVSPNETLLTVTLRGSPVQTWLISVANVDGLWKLARKRVVLSRSGRIVNGVL
jgi:hypothetical protein